MPDFKNMMIIKIVVAIIIFSVLISIKSVLFMNLEHFGLTYFNQNNFLEKWADFKGDYLFILISIAISIIIGLKFNIKAV
ncbi:MAG: hypothetical protein PHT91_03995 [Candidatus Nanoarchaeia archaeon]|nr:hypothetical protein [Candidatus Nanoarchaeia archaeon]MDD5054208.1 hypothetical protein [Candidatus Nanoarchaeia archaeon]MDD5500007.1 hypothetical protein [Candidatus Nanoarchaeia archaeon]